MSDRLREKERETERYKAYGHSHVDVQKQGDQPIRGQLRQQKPVCAWM